MARCQPCELSAAISKVINEETALTKRQIAHLFDVKLRQVELASIPLASEPVPGVENLYYFTDVIAWYRHFLTGGRDKADADLLRARADIAQMERDKMVGSLLHAQTVHDMMHSIYSGLRDYNDGQASRAGALGMPLEWVEWLAEDNSKGFDEAYQRLLTWCPDEGGGDSPAPENDAGEPVG